MMFYEIGMAPLPYCLFDWILVKFLVGTSILTLPIRAIASY